MVALGDGELGYTVVRKRILIVADMNMFGINHGYYQNLYETGTHNSIDEREHQHAHRNIYIATVEASLGIG